ncbi:hypothetical protein CUMW_092650 [Citrus unshiu]|nr:hypothetical protein CUMW_092650 [Citrus unshiu]
MEEVCLNSEPVFDEGDEYEGDGDCQEERGHGAGETHLKRDPPQPTVGLEFDSFDEAYDFYNAYGKERGFGIRVSNSWFRSKRKERYRAKLSCSSAGFKKKSEANNPRPETRTGCPAMIVIRLMDSKRWRIVEVELEHNHALSKVYTKEIFRRFQSEVEGMYSCFNTRRVTANGPITTYIVKERVEVEGNEKEVKNYEVLYETSQVDIRCICSLFNYKGYLCRHALNVLNYNGIEEIPSHYILARWSKDFKPRGLFDHDFNDVDMYNPLSRYHHLYKLAIPVLEEGAQSQDHYEVAVHELEELLNRLNLVEENIV